MFKKILVIEITDEMFNKDQPKFESDLNLELHVSMKDLRESIIEEYSRRRALLNNFYVDGEAGEKEEDYDVPE